MKDPIPKLSSPAFLWPASIVLFSVIYLIGCQDLNFGSLAFPEEGFLPYTCGFLLLGMGSLQVVLFLARKDNDSAPSFASRGELSHWIKMVVTLLLYMAFLPLLGFVICTFFATWLLSRIMGTSMRVGLILAFCITLVIQVLFRMWLRIPFPLPFFMD